MEKWNKCTYHLWPILFNWALIYLNLRKPKSEPFFINISFHSSLMNNSPYQIKVNKFRKISKTEIHRILISKTLVHFQESCRVEEQQLPCTSALLEAKLGLGFVRKRKTVISLPPLWMMKHIYCS